MKNVSQSLREHVVNKINFKKERNEVNNKIAAGIIWKFKTLLYL